MTPHSMPWPLSQTTSTSQVSASPLTLNSTPAFALQPSRARLAAPRQQASIPPLVPMHHEPFWQVMKPGQLG